MDTSSAEDLGGLAEDEEFAAEEHAHRCQKKMQYKKMQYNGQSHYHAKQPDTAVS
jgi:hypothetical protein